MRFRSVPVVAKLTNWNSRIRESSHIRKWQEVFNVYCGTQNPGVRLTDPSLFANILKACSNLSLGHGTSIHACLIKQGFQSFTSIENSTIDFYMKRGALDSALRVFNCMSRDSVSWNIMIHGHFTQGTSEEGLWWFMQARVAGFEPNISTLVLIIRACRSHRSKREGPKIHAYVIRSGFCAITSVQNSFLSMYADIDMGFAQTLFDEISEKDVISWSAMIGGYMQSGNSQVALLLFREMLSTARIEPDGITTVSVLKACAHVGEIGMGLLVHGFVTVRGFEDDLFVGNSLVDMYSECNDADSALKVFNEMPQKNVISWNSILSGFVHNERYLEATSLFYSMINAGVEADEVTLGNLLQTSKYLLDLFQCKLIHSITIRNAYESNELLVNSLIDAYAKCARIELAWKLFARMKRRDMISWNVMIAGFTHCGKPEKALAIFQEMNIAQVQPNAIVMLNVLEACSVWAELKRSKWAHAYAIRTGFASEVAVGTSILNMYSKCGAIEASRKAFDQITEKNVVSWSAMISAYGINGLPRDALLLLSEMKLNDQKPNAVTILSVLAACSHGGLVEEGLSLFKQMVQEQAHGIGPGPEHYSCVVDLLSRSGMLEGARNLIRRMPEQGLTANANAWGALLSASKSYQNSEIGANAISRAIELDPSNSASYIVASGLYALGGSWVNAANMRQLVRERGVMVMPGYSLVHVNDKAARFVAGDSSHMRCVEIFRSVEALHRCMKMDERNYASVCL